MNLIFADCETTGVSPKDKIVELAYAITDADMNILVADQSLIDPEMPIPSGASAVHHITNKMVEDEPTIDQYMRLRKMPLSSDEPMLFIAHNAPFDIRYFGPWMHEETRTFCTLRLARKLFPDADSHKLQALRYSLDLPEPDGQAHRADADVELLMNFVRYCMVLTGKTIYELAEMANQALEIKEVKFGKHKGKALKDVPLDYWQWLFKQDNVDPDLRASVLKIHPNLA